MVKNNNQSFLFNLLWNENCSKNSLFKILKKKKRTLKLDILMYPSIPLLNTMAHLFRWWRDTGWWSARGAQPDNEFKSWFATFSSVTQAGYFPFLWLTFPICKMEHISYLLLHNILPPNLMVSRNEHIFSPSFFEPRIQRELSVVVLAWALLWSCSKVGGHWAAVI